MPIEEVRVSNFRSIQDTGWVEFDSDILTLIGGNESGKSAFLDALQHTFDPEYEYDGSDLRNYRGCQGFSVVSSVKMEVTDPRLRDIIEKGIVHKLGGGSTIIADVMKGKIIPSKELYKIILD